VGEVAEVALGIGVGTGWRDIADSAQVAALLHVARACLDHGQPATPVGVEIPGMLRQVAQQEQRQSVLIEHIGHD